MDRHCLLQRGAVAAPALQACGRRVVVAPQARYSEEGPRRSGRGGGSGGGRGGGRGGGGGSYDRRDSGRGGSYDRRDGGGGRSYDRRDGGGGRSYDRRDGGGGRSYDRRDGGGGGGSYDRRDDGGAAYRPRPPNSPGSFAPRRPPPQYGRQQQGEEEGYDDRTAGSSGSSSAAPWSPPPPRGEAQDPFDMMHARMVAQLGEGLIVRRETWEKLFGHLGGAEQAGRALALMLADAAAREAAGWDWATAGYGQTAFQLVQAAASVGAPELAEDLLKRREELRLTLNKDLLPTLMRKVAAAAVDQGDEGHTDVVQRLYEQEAALRGANSPNAAYELSRVLRRAEDVEGVRRLYGQMVREGLAVRDGLLEDLQKWAAKQGVRL